MNKASVDRILANMHSAGKMGDYKEKGTAGEKAALALVLEHSKANRGGRVYHSFKYPYATNNAGVPYLGNVFYENGVYTDKTSASLYDEIDILYVTKFRIFVIEIKSYRAKIQIDNTWIKKNGEMEHKSPIWQTEKHCRHLYHSIWEVLPEGRPEYIVPVVCFVDKCTVKDERSDKGRFYIKCCILDTLLSTIKGANTPLKYALSREDVYQQLLTIKTSCEGEY